MKIFLITSALALVLAACAAQPESAADTPTDTIIALPSQNIGIAEEVIDAATLAFAVTAPGESLRSLSVADGSVITIINVADQKHLGSQKFKRHEYAGELARLEGFVRNANNQPLIDYTSFESDILSVFQSVGTIRSGVGRPTNLLLVAGGLQQTPDTPSTSMYADDRAVVAGDTLLSGDLLTSPYGIGDDRDDLKGVDVYFCPILPIKLSPYELQEVTRMWGHLVALRGGRLMAFTPDIDLCLEQFESGSTEPINLRPLDDQIEPAMIRADKSGMIKRITATEAEKHRQEIERIEAERDRERLNREAAEREAEEERNKPPQVITKTIYEDGARFEHVKHPTQRGLNVTTGVENAQDAKHGYINAWCYMQPTNSRGVRIWIDVATKTAGRKTQYIQAKATVLREAEISQQVFDAARQACRFPAN